MGRTFRPSSLLSPGMTSRLPDTLDSIVTGVCQSRTVELCRRYFSRSFLVTNPTTIIDAVNDVTLHRVYRKRERDCVHELFTMGYILCFSGFAKSLAIFCGVAS